MSKNDRIRKRQVAQGLEPYVDEAAKLARKLGLDPYPVNYWIVDHDEMNELIAYDGFQHRYPHWRWGMKYERQQKQAQFLGGKAFEIVNNDDPAAAFLQESNALADQKAVITHVEAHADFFANNEWFRDSPDAARLLERHDRVVTEIMGDPAVDRSEVEKWLDHLLCIQDNIDQHQAVDDPLTVTEIEDEDVEDPFEGLDVSDEVREEVLGDLLEDEDEHDGSTIPPKPEKDLLRFLRTHGKRYDEAAGKAVEMEPWQRRLISILRRESHYFAAQRMTKVMNEGWAAYQESLMMGEEAFADAEEFLDYADHQAQVLNSPGFNPYQLGKQLWEYVENRTNRREVVEHLLRVEGITWRNFHDAVDFDQVLETLEPAPEVESVSTTNLEDLDPDDSCFDPAALDAAQTGEIDVDTYPWKLLSYEGLARRHYSLVKPQNRSFLQRVTREELEQRSRYLFDDSKYASVEAALEEIDYTAGWDRMRGVRESHNDVTFIDEFLSQEFVDANDYFAYEYSNATEDYRATSTDYEDVKKKLLLRFTNLGKPTIAVYDGNYRNKNELLLGHQYNGVMLDIEEAKETLERLFELWGRPVNLKTIVKAVSEQAMEAAERRGQEPEPEERGVLIHYDGSEFEVEELEWDAVEELAATDVDYDTKPEDWLA